MGSAAFCVPSPQEKHIYKVYYYNEHTRIMLSLTVVQSGGGVWGCIVAVLHFTMTGGEW